MSFVWGDGKAPGVEADSSRRLRRGQPGTQLNTETEPLSPPPCPLQGVRHRGRARLRDNPGLPRRIPSRVGTDGAGHFPSCERPLPVRELLSRKAAAHWSPGPSPWLPQELPSSSASGKISPFVRMFLLSLLHVGSPLLLGPASLSSLGVSSMPAPLTGPPRRGLPHPP